MNQDILSLIATSNKIQLKPKIPAFLFHHQATSRQTNSYDRLSTLDKANTKKIESELRTLTNEMEKGKQSNEQSSLEKPQDKHKAEVYRNIFLENNPDELENRLNNDKERQDNQIVRESSGYLDSLDLDKKPNVNIPMTQEQPFIMSSGLTTPIKKAISTSTKSAILHPPSQNSKLREKLSNKRE